MRPLSPPIAARRDELRQPAGASQLQMLKQLLRVVRQILEWTAWVILAFVCVLLMPG